MQLQLLKPSEQEILDLDAEIADSINIIGNRCVNEIFTAIERSGRSIDSVARLIKARGCWSGTAIATAIALMNTEDRAWLLNKLNSNECYTPKPWIEFALSVFGAGIDLDIASNSLANQVVQANRFFTWKDDALKQEWSASTVWCNPPFSVGLIGKFVSKLIEQRSNYDQAIVLVNASMNSKWCQTLQQNTDRMLVPSARINFWRESTPDHERDDPSGSNAYDQVLFYIGGNTNRFEFFGRQLGTVFKCMN